MNQFGSYTIDRTIQTHDKFVIYHATDLEQKKSVCLKTLKAEFPDLRDVARLQREHNLIKELESNEIIKTLGIIRQGHQLAMVLEDILDGVSLQEYCKNRPCEIQEFLIIATQITRGLMALNERKIIHKNLNSSNIFYSPKNQSVKIIDLETSTHSLKENSEVASHNISKNSLPYISPEQTGWVNTGLDYRSDFYSLGCVFYELLTGKPPFYAEKKSDYFKQHVSQAPKPIHEINPNIPQVISDIIRKLLEKSAEDRYQSSYGLYKDLLKCQSLDTKSDISWSFPLAEDDIADQFIISNKLYGREKELSVLKQTLSRTIDENKLGIITVSGFAGVGKTALIKELEQQIKLNNGIFVGGKFDQYQRELPYHALTEAFGAIIDHVMQSDEQPYWTEKLKTALAENGRIISDLVPKLKHILGELPTPPDLGPKESYNRFLATVNQFIQIFSDPNHPLVIFIDDLQWATNASINLIQDIAQKNENNSLILIFSYRSNEIDAGHPFLNLVSTIEKTCLISRIELLPLQNKDINKIVADSLHRHEKSCEDLAELIYERSAGNPFFANELLSSLHEQGYIDFDYDRGEWRWEIEKIRALPSSDNVVEFMMTRLLQLPATTLTLLKKAACIGNRFDSKLLADVAEYNIAELDTHLEPALKAQILVALSNDHALEGIYDGNTIEAQIQVGVLYRFQHDRIQQATYEMIDELEKPTIHLLIGKTMQKAYSKQEMEDKVVSITNHMNKARSLINRLPDQLKLAELNLAAGIKAKASIAYHTAYEFLKTGISLLSPESWDQHYSLSYALYEQFSQSAFLSGEFADAENSNDILLTHARTALEKAKIYRMRAVQYTINGKSETALDACINGLYLLGIKLKKNASTLSVLIELFKAKIQQGFKPIESLADLPLMRDLEKIVCMQLLMEMVAPCYTLGHKNLFAKTILRQVTLSIRYGNTKEASYAYAAYGLLLGEIFNQPKSGYAFGEMAVTLNQNLNDISLRCRILFVFYSFIFPWHKPFRELYDVYKKIINIGYQSGDLLYVNYAAQLCLLLPPENTLADSIKLGDQYIEMVSATKYKEAMLLLKVFQQFRLSLRDRENSQFFKINSHSEIDFLNNLRAQEYDSLLTGYLIKKLIDSYIFGDYKFAYDSLNETEKSLEAMLGSLATEEYYVFATLTLSHHYNSKKNKTQKNDFTRIKNYYLKVKKWASQCEVNFLQHALLLEATLLRIKNKNKKAAKIYEKAISAAQKNNFLHDEALICEETARFYLGIDNPKQAEKYMKQAHYAYLEWGALAKVKQLESTFPYLKAKTTDELST